tara:strand:+ start:2080 stop:2541 length:462 start_codon:yes stop_codon:yes gene_type:complete
MRKMLLLLAEHTDIIEVEGEKDICVFHDGWSDERVAEEMGHKNAGKIRTSRARYFGRLPVTVKETQNNDLVERIKQVEANVEIWRQQLIVDKADQEAGLQKVKTMLDQLERAQTAHRQEQSIAQKMLEKLRPLIDEPEPTAPIKTNGQTKELN